MSSPSSIRSEGSVSCTKAALNWLESKGLPLTRSCRSADAPAAPSSPPPPPPPAALFPASSPPPLVYQSYVNAAYEPPALGTSADTALLTSASPAVPAVRRSASVSAGVEEVAAAGGSPEEDASAEESQGNADAGSTAEQQSDASESTRTAPGAPASELSAIAAGSAAFVLARSNPLNTMRLWRASAGVSPFALPVSTQEAKGAAETVQSAGGVPCGQSQGRRGRGRRSVRWEDRRFQEKLDESSRMRNLCAGLTCFFLSMAVVVLAVVLTGSA
eukprot:Rhum_TRINITY_DN14668_c11_g1::Rhum_TRINITY_DN14668_c11_g1_i1::g.109319::m.109319